jgi:NADPH2:quinone reductase
MQVVQVTKFGGPEVLSPAQAPDPVAGAGEVVIATAAADVLFVDTMIRGGGGGEVFPVRPPYVPGGGVAGAVLSVGDARRPRRDRHDSGWRGRREPRSSLRRGASGSWRGSGSRARTS